MQTFDLPATTVVNRVIPKNSFDKFTTAKQKKSFADLIDKIRWANKLSRETINLSGREFSEIQIFEITLKKKDSIADLLNIIDRSIPYPIIFIIVYEHKITLSASFKHPHPTNENSAVIDWTFSSDWRKEIGYQLNLQRSLDFIWIDFCKQISGRVSEKLTLTELIAKERKTKELQTTIASLQAAIKTSRQFNKKVELNVELQKRLKELKSIA